MCSSDLCSCPAGSVGDPLKGRSGCRPAGLCVRNNDCPATAVCQGSKCVDACASQCGRNAECKVIAQVPHCVCPTMFTGNPLTECQQMECLDSSDCKTSESCISNKCVNPCTLENTCGANTNCEAINHQAGKSPARILLVYFPLELLYSCPRSYFQSANARLNTWETHFRGACVCCNVPTTACVQPAPSVEAEFAL